MDNNKKISLYQSDYEIERNQRNKEIMELYENLTKDYPNASILKKCKTIQKYFWEQKSVRISTERLRCLVINYVPPCRQKNDK